MLSLTSPVDESTHLYFEGDKLEGIKGTMVDADNPNGEKICFVDIL